MQTVISNLTKEAKTILKEINNCNSRLTKSKMSERQTLLAIKQKEELLDSLHELAEKINEI